jgi:ATP-binding cassette subfamily B protein
VREETLRQVDPRLLHLLEDSGILTAQRFYVTTIRTSSQRLVVQAHPELFYSRNHVAYIAHRDLSQLPSASLLRLRGGDLRALWLLGAIFAAVLLVSAACTYGQNLLMVYAGQNMMHDLRMQLFEHLEKLSLAFFGRHPVGRLVTRLTNDVQNLDEMFGTVVMTLLKDAVLLCGILLILFHLHWRLTLITLSVVPLVVVLFHLFGVQVRGAFREIRARLARINTALNEYISGIRVIQIFRQEGGTLRRFQSLNREYYRATLRQITVQAVFFPCIELLSTATIALLLWYGGRQVLSGTLSLGALVAFISYLRMFFGPIRDISQKYSVMQSAMASAERIFQLIDTHEEEESPAGAARLPAVKGEIEYRGVTFSYGNDTPVLRDVSFRVSPGETLAIVGVTGAGKTTLMHLLEGFYRPERGRILLDGRDTIGMDLSWLRRQVGLIMQDVFLFPGTLRDNILLDRSLSPEELDRIVRLAHLERLVSRLPEGLDTPVHEGGVTLSMGQRQLLAIARAMAYDPRVLILDEATASIDTETEHLIQQALERLFEGRTTLVIAHRLSTIQKADRILVLHRGRIVEDGTHRELMARGAFYYQLYQLQFAYPAIAAGTSASPA